MKYQTTRGYNLRRCLEKICTVIPDGNLTISSKRGLLIRGSTADIFLDFVMRPSGTESITEEGNNESTIGLDFKLLTSWLKGTKPGDIISMSVDKKELDKEEPLLLFQHWNESENHQIYLPMLTTFPTLPPLDLTFYFKFIVNNANFDAFISRHMTASKNVAITAHVPRDGLPPKLNIWSSVDGATNVSAFDCTSPVIEPGTYGNRHAYFGSKTLRILTKVSTMTTNLTLYLPPSNTPKVPLILQYTFGSWGTLTFALTQEKDAPLAESPSSPKAESPKKKKKIKRKKKRTLSLVPIKSPKKKRKEEKITHYAVATSQKCLICNGYPLTDGPALVDYKCDIQQKVGFAHQHCVDAMTSFSKL